MSKIAEQKASEAYPNALIGNLDNLKKDGFIKGYDQAMQDFLEKAMEYFKGKPIHPFWAEDFKKYMEGEL